MVVRKDKLRNKAKVIKEVLKNPELTEREIAKKTGLGKGTVNRHKQELGQNGAESQVIDRICANDKELIDLVAGLNVKVAKKIINKKEVKLYDLKTLNDIAEKSTKRYTLFKGNITDDEGGLKLEASEQELLNNLLD